MEGTADGAFSPDAPVTRAELIATLWRFTQKSGSISAMEEAMSFIVKIPEENAVSRLVLAEVLAAYCAG